MKLSLSIILLAFSTILFSQNGGAGWSHFEAAVDTPPGWSPSNTLSDNHSQWAFNLTTDEIWFWNGSAWVEQKKFPTVAGTVISSSENIIVGDSLNTVQQLIDLMQDSIPIDTAIYNVNFPADVSSVIPIVGRAVFVNYTGEIRYCNGTNCNTVLQLPNGTRAKNSISVVGATLTPDNTATCYNIDDAGAITINNPTSSHGERSRYLFRLLNTSASPNTINLGTSYYDNVGNQIGSINVAGNAETVLEFEQVNGVFVLQSSVDKKEYFENVAYVSPSGNNATGRVSFPHHPFQNLNFNRSLDYTTAILKAGTYYSIDSFLFKEGMDRHFVFEPGANYVDTSATNLSGFMTYLGNPAASAGASIDSINVSISAPSSRFEMLEDIFVFTGQGKATANIGNVSGYGIGGTKRLLFNLQSKDYDIEVGDIDYNGQSVFNALYYRDSMGIDTITNRSCNIRTNNIRFEPNSFTGTRPMAWIRPRFAPFTDSRATFDFGNVSFVDTLNKASLYVTQGSFVNSRVHVTAKNVFTEYPSTPTSPISVTGNDEGIFDNYSVSFAKTNFTTDVDNIDVRQSIFGAGYPDPSVKYELDSSEIVFNGKIWKAGNQGFQLDSAVIKNNSRFIVNADKITTGNSSFILRKVNIDSSSLFIVKNATITSDSSVVHIYRTSNLSERVVFENCTFICKDNTKPPILTDGANTVSIILKGRCYTNVPPANWDTDVTFLVEPLIYDPNVK